MDSKFVTGIVIGGVVLAGASFYGGMQYQKSHQPQPGQFGRGAGGPGARSGQDRVRGGMTFGEILSKDAESVTVKQPDGSTKIVLVGASTEVVNSVAATIDDLAIGTSVIVQGTGNSDGSVTAQNIQVRPEGAPAFRGFPPQQQQGQQ